MTVNKNVIAKECNDCGNPRNKGRSGLHNHSYTNLRVCSPVEAGEGATLPKVATLRSR